MDLTREPLTGLLARRAELLAEAKAITNEVKRRGIARTDNFIGEIGEHLARTVYGGELMRTSARDIDLVDSGGRRIQVKARELPAGDLRRYTFSTLDFDAAICIRFDRATFHLDWAREIDLTELSRLAQPYRSEFRLSGTRARDAGRDVTPEFQGAWMALQTS